MASEDRHPDDIDRDKGARAGRDTDATHGRREPLPVMIPPAGRRMPALTNAELSDLLDAEDIERPRRH